MQNDMSMNIGQNRTREWNSDMVQQNRRLICILDVNSDISLTFGLCRVLSSCPNPATPLLPFKDRCDNLVGVVMFV